MVGFLLYVTGQESHNGRKYYVAEPLLPDCGPAKFVGELFAIDALGTKSVGRRQILQVMIEHVGLLWQIDGATLPPSPFFLTDDPLQKVTFDRRIRFMPSELFLTRTRFSHGKAFAVRAENHWAVLWLESGKYMQLLVLGSGSLPDFVAVREVDDTNEFLGWANTRPESLDL